MVSEEQLALALALTTFTNVTLSRGNEAELLFTLNKGYINTQEYKMLCFTLQFLLTHLHLGYFVSKYILMNFCIIGKHNNMVTMWNNNNTKLFMSMRDQKMLEDTVS